MKGIFACGAICCSMRNGYHYLTSCQKYQLMTWSMCVCVSRSWFWWVFLGVEKWSDSIWGMDQWILNQKSDQDFKKKSSSQMWQVQRWWRLLISFSKTSISSTYGYKYVWLIGLLIIVWGFIRPSASKGQEDQRCFEFMMHGSYSSSTSDSVTLDGDALVRSLSSQTWIVDQGQGLDDVECA